MIAAYKKESGSRSEKPLLDSIVVKSGLFRCCCEYFGQKCFCALSLEVRHNLCCHGLKVRRLAASLCADFAAVAMVAHMSAQPQFAVFNNAVRRQRHLAGAAQSAAHGTLGAGCATDVFVVNEGKQFQKILSIGSHFDAQCALPRCRQTGFHR